MNVLVYATGGWQRRSGNAPALVMPELTSDVFLPPHPQGLSWTYFATMSIDDDVFKDERDGIRAKLDNGLSYTYRHLMAFRGFRNKSRPGNVLRFERPSQTTKP